MVDLIIGVDPGTQGGIVIISRDHKDVHLFKLSKKSKQDIKDFIEYHTPWGVECEAFFENVHSFPGEGVSSAHTFGRVNGHLEMALLCYEVPIKYIVPQVWQRGMALAKVVGDRKKAHLAKAKALFPELKGLNLETCDAVLIAEYGWRQTFMTKNP